MLQRHERLAFAGSVHFITTVTRVRGNWFTTDKQCENLLRLFENYRAQVGIDRFGYVLMPDHLHALLIQREDGLLIPALMEGFKGLSARQCRPFGYPEGSLWARRYDDVPVPGSEAARTKLNYLHNNPIRRGLAERPDDYSWSSARELMGLGKGMVSLSPF